MSAHIGVTYFSSNTMQPTMSVVLNVTDDVQDTESVRWQKKHHNATGPWVHYHIKGSNVCDWMPLDVWNATHFETWDAMFEAFNK